MIFEWDDFGCDHIISDQCQSHDCRDQLLRLKEVNPAFKATLFAIPAQMTMELLFWCTKNMDWIELAVHGFKHDSNYECEKWTYDDMDNAMSLVASIGGFTRCFRAPGWQISDDCLKWLADKGWVVADQSYNDERRSEGMKAYLNYDGNFVVRRPDKDYDEEVDAYHGHTWNVGWNGIYEDYDKVESLVREAKEFKFITELF